MRWMLRPLRHYVDFTGRSQRQEYWMFVLFSALLYTAGFILLSVLIGMSAPSGKTEDPSWLLGPVVGFGVIILIYVGLFVPTLAVQVRRFHDQDLSGFFALIGFIPYLGWLIIVIFMCMDGTAGRNRFGPDPKGRGGGGDADIFA